LYNCEAMIRWLSFFVCLPLCAQWPIDWNIQRTEILKHYRALIQIDTRAGNETEAVEYLRRVLEAEGISTKTFALNPARANLVARLKGNGSKRPLLILAHTDVVGVQPEKWPVDPFSAALKDGYVWGRGSVDDKCVLAANLMTMLLLKRNRVALDRDVIFLAESGEEADYTGVGINFMVEKHYDEIDAEFSLTEFGGATIDGGKVVKMDIGTAEKLPARVRLVATGTSGHGSAPRTDNALIHLSAAVEKVGRWQTPMRLNDTTRTYFEKLATISSPEIAAHYNGLFRAESAEASQRYLQETDPRAYSMLRTSVVPTMLKAGVGANVIPSEAEATLDIRALPDEDIPKFYAEMASIINDPAIKILPLPATRPPSPPSRLDTEMYRILERVSKELYPGVTVIPQMSAGSSDKAQLRAKGQQSYGIGPAGSIEDRTNYSSHSDVERLAEASIYPFVEFVWKAVTEVAGTRR
jgi:acetylornithine deacetylase/succinyl-diaminopimelate desuccinylase-like protein